MHDRKEIENFLLVPTAMDRAARRRVQDKSIRTATSATYQESAASFLADFALQRKSYVMAQVLASRRQFERKGSSGLHEATITEASLKEFEEKWENVDARIKVIPGKDALSAFNQHLQANYGISITPTAIVDSMVEGEVPMEMRQLLDDLSRFASASAP
jgi:hypothetical protein